MSTPKRAKHVWVVERDDEHPVWVFKTRAEATRQTACGIWPSKTVYRVAKYVRATKENK